MKMIKYRETQKGASALNTFQIHLTILLFEIQSQSLLEEYKYIEDRKKLKHKV